MSLDSPLISVITATYNRSNVLFYSISSVVRSTFSDCELLVGGDACTDNTEEVVGSFGDPRIRFFNLENELPNPNPKHSDDLLHRQKRLAEVFPRTDQ